MRLRLASAAALSLGAVLASSAGTASAATEAGATVVLVHGWSLPALLGVPCLREMAADGGAGLVSPDDTAAGFRARLGTPAGLDVVDATGSDAAALDATCRQLPSHALALVVGVGPGPAGEPAVPVVASWTGGQSGPPRALTSDSTHRTGVLIPDDLVATVDAALDVPIPSDVAGSPVHPADAPAPTDLYRRYLEQRRLVVPIGTIATLYVGFAGLAGVWALRRRAPSWGAQIAAGLGVSIFPLSVALLEAGHLPRLTYATAVPFLAAVTLAGSVLAVVLARRLGPTAALGIVGVLTFGAISVEAVTGWAAAITPLLGGAQLDGGRFFGMPNVEVGLVLGATIAIAQSLPDPRPGVVVVFAAALMAGLPSLGANIGAAITLAAAAGIWLGVSERRPIRVTALLAAAGAVAAGVAVFAANRLLATPTYVTRAIDEANGLGDIVHHWFDRLGVGFDLIARNPFALIPVVGTLALGLVALRPPAAIRAAFDRHPVWQDAAVTVAAGSVVAYFVNDSGAAALGLGFGTGLGSMLFVSLASRAWKMESE